MIAMSAIYRSLISTIDRRMPHKLLPLWQHPAGPKTIFFWAPIMKWGLVLASLSDIARPTEKISPRQTSSLIISGLIWQRWAWIIKPRNYWLMSVNCLVAVTNSIQLGRFIQYKLAHPQSCSQAH